MMGRALVALVICLQLVACESPSGPQVAAPPPAEPSAPPSMKVPVPPTKPPPPRPVAKPAPTPPPAPAAKPPADPEELVGLDEDSLRRLLGSPADSSNNGAARVVTYRAGSCELEVFLFLDVRTGNLKVLSYEVNDGRGKAAPQARACYDEIRSEHQ